MVEERMQGGNAALLLATFSSNDFVVSGTEGFHGNYHSTLFD
jgi:hypothetical protein